MLINVYPNQKKTPKLAIKSPLKTKVSPAGLARAQKATYVSLN